jgi:hypothetical protein
MVRELMSKYSLRSIAIRSPEHGQTAENAQCCSPVGQWVDHRKVASPSKVPANLEFWCLLPDEGLNRELKALAACLAATRIAV